MTTPWQAAVPGASDDSPMIMTTAVKMLPILRPMRSTAKPRDTIPTKRPATCNTRTKAWGDLKEHSMQEGLAACPATKREP